MAWNASVGGSCFVKRRSARVLQIHGPADIEHSNLGWGNVANTLNTSVWKIMSFVHAARIWWCGKRI